MPWHAFGVPLACRRHVLVENYISTRSAHFSTVFFHTCLKLGNRQSGQAVFAWGRDFHTLFHTLWKTGFCGFVAGCRTGVGYDIFCDFCIICLVCLLGYLVNRVGLWGGRGVVAGRPCLAGTRRGLTFLVARLPFYFSLLSCPHPPDPLPGGKGETLGYFMQGASPLASPGLYPGGTGFSCGKQCPNGGLPGRLPADLALPEPSGELARVVADRPRLAGTRRGACLFGRLPTLPLACFPAPHPPDPLPLRGRGRLKVILCKGLRPLHPRR